MRRLASLLVSGALVALPALGVGCDASPDARTAAPVADRTATLRVEGMTCASCAVTIRAAASKVEGVASIEVDVDAGTATVTFDSARVGASEIARRITAAGYAASVVSDEAA